MILARGTVVSNLKALGARADIGYLDTVIGVKGNKFETELVRQKTTLRTGVFLVGVHLGFVPILVAEEAKYPFARWALLLWEHRLVDHEPPAVTDLHVSVAEQLTCLAILRGEQLHRIMRDDSIHW